MGNLSPHMLHNFYIIEPTRNCLINKASRKPSKSRRVKRRVLVCQLILWMLNPLRFPVLSSAFHFLLGDIFSSLGGISVVSWQQQRVYVHQFHLHAPLVTSCITGGVAGSAWISLMMTTTSIVRILSFRRTEDFFLYWSSLLTKLWLFYRKDEIWRHKTCLHSPMRALAWEENCIFKFRCTFIDPFLCLSQSIVNMPEF